MLCHNKKRQRLKEYINYKLNKYYTVIFTLIIWDFFVFSFLFVLCSSKYWPFLFPTMLLPPMGPFHKPVNTKLWKPIVLTCYIQKVLCTQKKSCTVVTVLLTYEMWILNHVGDVKPEDVTTRKQALVLKPEKNSTCNPNKRNKYLEHWSIHALDWSRQWMVPDIR